MREVLWTLSLITLHFCAGDDLESVSVCSTLSIRHFTSCSTIDKITLRWRAPVYYNECNFCMIQVQVTDHRITCTRSRTFTPPDILKAVELPLGYKLCEEMVVSDDKLYNITVTPYFKNENETRSCALDDDFTISGEESTVIESLKPVIYPVISTISCARSAKLVFRLPAIYQNSSMKNIDPSTPRLFLTGQERAIPSIMKVTKSRRLSFMEIDNLKLNTRYKYKLEKKFRDLQVFREGSFKTARPSVQMIDTTVVNTTVTVTLGMTTVSIERVKVKINSSRIESDDFILCELAKNISLDDLDEQHNFNSTTSFRLSVSINCKEKLLLNRTKVTVEFHICGQLGPVLYWPSFLPIQPTASSSKKAKEISGFVFGLVIGVPVSIITLIFATHVIKQVRKRFNVRRVTNCWLNQMRRHHSTDDEALIDMDMDMAIT